LSHEEEKNSIGMRKRHEFYHIHPIQYTNKI